MNKYHKIQTVFKRDPETKFKTFVRRNTEQKLKGEK